MDENKPHQSEFLKTLIEKSHRKNGSALKNIYATINKKKERESQNKRPKKFIELRENTASKEDRPESGRKPQIQYSVPNNPLEDKTEDKKSKILRISAKSRKHKRESSAKSNVKNYEKKSKLVEDLKYSFPLSTKTKDIKEGINLGYYFSGQFMKNKTTHVSAIKNPKSLNSVNFTENFFDPRNIRPKRIKTKLNTSNDRVHHSNLKNFSQNKINQMKHKKNSKSKNEGSIITPSNNHFTNTQRTSSIEKSNLKKHYLLSSFSRIKSGKKGSPFNQTALYPDHKHNKKPKISANYMSLNYPKQVENLGFQGESQMQDNKQIKSTLTPLNRKEKKYELLLFSEKKKLRSQEKAKKSFRDKVDNKQKSGIHVSSKDSKNKIEKSAKRKEGKEENKSEITCSNEVKQKETSSNQKKKNSKKISLSIQTTENISHNTINNNFKKKKVLKSNCNITLEDCLITQKENTEENKRKKKVQHYLQILENKSGLTHNITPDFNEIKSKVKSCFKNWSSSSLAEFFDFKSNKGLYKIKVKQVYTLLKYQNQIGRGCFGKVYLARQILTNQKVALKVIPKLSIKQKDVRAKIEKEVRILKKVNSNDNIIKLYEVFEDRNYVYLVFELLERGDLVNFFRENTLLEEDELRTFFREIGKWSLSN